jgi:signal transduction histidine kinase
VISNLLSNAIKYSPTDQIILITSETLNGHVRVSVKDKGTGIKEEDKKRIFERYYRVESKASEHISGFGIGLYLSAEIIGRHDGKIGVESAYGEGSTFFFTLPYSDKT